MEKQPNRRRDFLKDSVASATGLFILPTLPSLSFGAVKTEVVQPVNLYPHSSPRIKFAVMGMNHGHIYGQTEAVIRGGGELVACFAKEADLLAEFTKRYPQAKVAANENAILEDSSIQLVLSSITPVERAPLGIRVMKSGKDYMADKPGITTLAQLAQVKKVQKETGRIYSIMYSERFENKATVKAGELVQAGAIGKIIQTIGLGPHRMNIKSRPPWFFDKKYFGGIICDIASHQFDQFLYFTGSTKAEIIASQIGNTHFPQYPQFEDFGDAMVRGNKGIGYIRVDWFTPDGLKSWGDGRLTILGTEGFIEIRKNIDPGGRTGGNHLFLTDHKETRYFDCREQDLPYGRQLVDDVVNRTETSMSQHHCFLATELALKAQTTATNISFESN
jgi:predicted dehydrogenase